MNFELIKNNCFSFLKPKISLFSRFERVIDRRTMAERRDFFNLKPDEERVFVKKQSKFTVQTEKNTKKKTKSRKQREDEAAAAAEE